MGFDLSVSHDVELKKHNSRIHFYKNIEGRHLSTEAWEQNWIVIGMIYDSQSPFTVRGPKEWSWQTDLKKKKKNKKKKTLTGIVGMGILDVGIRSEAGEAVVRDFKHETIIHHTVGGFEVAMGDNHTVMQESHTLQRW